ncbi:uncharacterized protein LOC130989716 [Salvia miltiorrhiza]|uniref:uncharacterized protein LOC130989716 n=1 Tax=Salvia miltiorrhiza TaxID=226208 RepID=UPI0025AD3E7A|nr:uncharacterized protein LOC130989716 [Salvia miltiorrhiza]XP_057769768.1 uncharacterized protein LOC130989716 [Salvia miltiorrhiza]XP_057769769.1 uncharacterized protein LOC130989716 [Salvia miltiorrhiza]XP_057769770.1 uncharacterized protein LOC130989716 [Salvia miltiorrhiza]XP_057769771.1 uncharacterized protein LOC130989716 [Salvia miltiorrhiza]XP_057769772.1 uncharacterized protein LOC130989716 [Salvia miltiorrhiza]
MSTRFHRGRLGGSSSAASSRATSSHRASSRASSTLPASTSDVELEQTTSDAVSNNDGRIPLSRTLEGELALYKDFSRVIDNFLGGFKTRQVSTGRLLQATSRIYILRSFEACRKPDDKRRPGYICDDQWKALCANWDTLEAIQKSKRASKARLSEPDGPSTGISKHRGGSKSVAVRAHEMARVKANAEQQRENVDLSQIYVDEVMGGRLDKKKRMFGTGTIARSLVGGTSQTFHSQ